MRVYKYIVLYADNTFQGKWPIPAMPDDPSMTWEENAKWRERAVQAKIREIRHQFQQIADKTGVQLRFELRLKSRIAYAKYRKLADVEKLPIATSLQDGDRIVTNTGRWLTA